MQVAEAHAQVVTDADRADVDIAVQDLVPLRTVSWEVLVGASGGVHGADLVEGVVAVVLQHQGVDRVTGTAGGGPVDGVVVLLGAESAPSRLRATDRGPLDVRSVGARRVGAVGGRGAVTGITMPVTGHAERPLVAGPLVHDVVALVAVVQAE